MNRGCPPSSLLGSTEKDAMEIVDRVRQFFDRRPEVKRDDDGVYIEAGGVEYRAATLGDLEAELRSRITQDSASDATDNAALEEALAVVRNEREKQQGLP
jgi:hypothetical protein